VGAFALGVLTDLWLAPPAPLWAGLAAAGLGVALAEWRRRPLAARTGLILGFLLLGGLLHALRGRAPLPADHVLHHCPPTGAVRVEATVRSALRPAGPDRWRVDLDARRVESEDRTAVVSGRLRLTLGRLPEEALLPGDVVRLWARVRPPRSFRVPGGLDRPARLARQGIHAVAYLPDAQRLVLVARSPEPSLSRRLATRVEAVRGVLDAAGSVDLRGRALLGALALGEGGALPPAVRLAFDNTGTSHLLAVSGLHLGLVVAGCFLLLRWLLSRSEGLLLWTDVRRWSALGCIPLAWAYALLTGASTPTLRAAVVASCMLAGMALGRRGDLASALALAALALLVVQPDALLDPSFQLSFSAVVAVAAATPVLLRVFERPTLEPPGQLARVRRWILSLACASLAASLATAPIVAAHFQRAAPGGPLANLLLVPVVAFGVLPLALGVVLLAPWPALAGPLASGAVWVAGRAVDLAEGLAALPLGAGTVPSPTALEHLLWYAALVGAWAFARGARRFGPLVLVAVGLLLVDVAAWAWLPRLRTDLEAWFLDVGQGDATLLRLPGGHHALIDAGGLPPGAPDPGELAVVPALLAARARKLDLVVLSHPDRDHCGGLAAVLDAVPVGEIWTNGDEGDAGCAAALASARAAGVLVREVHAGLPWARLGAVTLRLHHPARDAPERDRNDRSIVLAVEHGGIRFLFTGDIGQGVEDRLRERRGDAALRADVVKVPHHGSAGSSSLAFVDAADASHAVVSAGRSNRFGLPRLEVLERWEAAGARVHRTDLEGTIVLRSDGVGVRRVSSP